MSADKSRISDVINGFLSKEETLVDILNKKERFSITLNRFQNARLDVLMDKVGTTKQEFISRLMEAALLELEEKLNLIDSTSKNPDGSTSTRYRGKYDNEIGKALGFTQDEWDELRFGD